LDDGFIGDGGNDAQEIIDAVTVKRIRVWDAPIEALLDFAYFDGFAVVRHIV
jgi:hypothetical protein